MLTRKGSGSTHFPSSASRYPIEGWSFFNSVCRLFSLRSLACGLQNGQFQGFGTMIKYLRSIQGSHDNTWGLMESQVVKIAVIVARPILIIQVQHLGLANIKQKNTPNQPKKHFPITSRHFIQSNLPHLSHLPRSRMCPRDSDIVYLEHGAHHDGFTMAVMWLDQHRLHGLPCQCFPWHE